MERGTHVKSVRITLNIFAVHILLFLLLRTKWYKKNNAYKKWCGNGGAVWLIG